VDDPTSTPEVSQPPVVGPPTRRRLPVLKIAAVVMVVLIGGLCWWSWPRIDSRLVGTWDIYDSKVENPTSLDGLEPPGRQIWKTDGRVAQYDGGVAHDGGIFWRVSGSRLIISAEMGLLEQLQGFAQQASAMFLGKQYWPNRVSFELRVVAPDRIVVRDSSEPETYYILKRVSPADPVR
jgi:hypothetical protein